MAEVDDGRNEFRATLHILESEERPGGDLITLFIPPGKPIADVTEYLKEEYIQSGTIRDTRDRQQAQDALSSVIAYLKRYADLPVNGLALFCRGGSAENETDHRCTIIEPPEPIGLYLFRRSTKFELEPLMQMLEAKNVYGLLVLDLSGAWWGTLRGDQVKPLGHSTSSIPAKQRKGGQSSARFQRLREIAVNEFYSRVGNHASDAFLAEKDFYQRFGGVLIGGQGQTKEDFFSGHFLHHEIQQRVIGLFDITRKDEKGLAELANNAQDAIGGKDIPGDKDLLDRFRYELKKADGLAASGEESVRRNLATGSVGTLLVSAGLRKPRRRITCRKCGHADERTMLLEPGLNVQDILVHTCRICADPIIEDEEVDLIEELTHLANQRGAKTKIISEKSEEGLNFLKEYGGIAAILRYRTGF
jgi:peptide chain release factor subunit 1